MNPKSPIKVAAYSRVSTLLGQDPTLQLVPIKTFATARGFDLVQEFVDKGISGAKDRRPGLDQLVLGARRGEYKIVIVAAIDRLARNVRHLVNLIHELNGYGCSIISLRENLDFSTPLGQAVLVIIGVLAELEREITRERIRNSLAAKKKLALDSGSDWRCGRPLVVTEEKCKQVLALRSKGLSIRQIERELDRTIGRSSIAKILKGGGK